MLKKKKGINPILSAVFVLVISMVGVGIVLNIGMPALERSRENMVFDEARGNLDLIESTIETVRLGDEGVSRTITLGVTDGKYSINEEDNTVNFEYEMDTQFLPSALCRNDNGILTRTFGDGRVLDLRFREGSGNTTADCSRYENHGLFVNDTEWTEDIYGNVVSFCGEGSHINVGSDESLHQEEFTVSAFVKPGVDDFDGYQAIVSSESNYGLMLTSEEGDLYVSGGYEKSGDIGIGSSVVEIVSESTVDPNKWTHIAMKLDLSREELAIFIDGEKDATKSASEAPEMDTGNRTVGWVPESIRDLDYYPFDGLMSDVRIYNHALEESEIEEISRRGNVGEVKEVKIKISTKNTNITEPLELTRGTHNLLVRNLGYEDGFNIEIKRI